MENLASFRYLALALLVLLTVLVAPANGQTNTACTGAMMRSFNPCIGFLTGGGSGRSSSPTTGCCSSLRDLMSNGQDCLCLIVTGGVPFQVPINRTLAISLPRACRMSGVPVECKATASPVPAPGSPDQDPDQPNLSPGLSPPSPTAPFLPQPLTPPTGGGMAPPTGDVVPTLTPPGMRPTLSPSAAARASSQSVWPSVLIASALGVVVSMKLY